MFKITFTVLILLFISLTLGTKAYCQTGDSEQKIKTSYADTIKYQTDEVVVTGTRVEQKIIDIPYPVYRINNYQFQFDRKVSINDVLISIPGVFMQSRYGNHDVRISIRGFGSRSNTGIRGIRILLDGIPESEPDGQTRVEAIDFNALGSIEVVKGNSSSLYTNAPGGVINFINDINFDNSFIKSFNEFGSFGMRQNGIKAGVKGDGYKLMVNYNYHNYEGYRAHSQDYWHILNTVLETNLGKKTNLQILGYFANGIIKLPGSLTQDEFALDPYQAVESREVAFDFRRVTKKGRIGLRFNNYFDDEKNHQFELTTYGTIKYFERVSKSYRVFNRYGLGSTARYIFRAKVGERKNEFSIGNDLFYQTGPIEEYNTVNGQKDDILNFLSDESISNVGFYVQNNFEILPDQFSLLVSGRYDNVIFDNKNQQLAAQNSNRRFEAFTPKAAFNFKLTPSIAVYTSYGLSFDSPAGNELDNFPLSSDPGKLLNPDLQPQKSKNFEVGIKGNIISFDSQFFRNINFEATFFNTKIEDEIVPFEIFGDVFFRNSATTNRLGIELGGEAEILSGLNMKLSYTYSDFSYDSYSAEVIDLDSLNNIITSIQDFGGNVSPSVPKHNIFSALAYRHFITNEISAFVRATYNHVSGMFVNDQNSEKTSDYNIVGASIGSDIVLNNLNLLLSVGMNNIFDRTYVGFISINSTSGRFYEAGEPQTFYGSLNVSYRL